MKTISIYRRRNAREKEFVSTIRHPEALKEIAAVLRKWELMTPDPKPAFQPGADLAPHPTPQKPEVHH